MAILSISGLFLDDFLEARAVENADGDPIGSEKVATFVCLHKYMNARN